MIELLIEALNGLEGTDVDYDLLDDLKEAESKSEPSELDELL